MTTNNFRFLLVLLALLCGEHVIANPKVSFDKDCNLILNFEASKIDTLPPNRDTTLEYILFGVYCGECIGRCATMYKYHKVGNMYVLFADHTDSFFKNYGEVKCSTAVPGLRKSMLASSIVRKIPNQFLTVKKTKRFGCPDCTDGCGIYFEFKLENTTRMFYIDTETSKLPREIKAFVEYLKVSFEKINATEKDYLYIWGYK